ncbi:unnamed protein product [Chrysodeixis includens]|uniref:Protein slender lobes n=1 Tax=Chrysodeixis includens TaxID=689277 RepID=A0A9P0C4P9_CHRIL|nr:unnamed protein product [Chrysodeixis includens]
MEEEVGIKGTRLRRRLSVDTDDVKSPSSQSTPTKKRGRPSAKPQLELIDENAPDLVTKKTTKAIAAEEKVLTPARRSQRIRSNTSILSMTPEPEEKSTPARRATRVKSNASSVAEVASTTTPRAKRAARRNSQIGSDNDAPVTPARQTRRTRKDSTSSVDRTADKGERGQINRTIVEETENTRYNSPIRTSPRLSERALSHGQPVVQLEIMNLQNKLDTSTKTSKTEDGTKAVEEKRTENNNLSITSSNLIKDLDNVPKKPKNDMNKSTNALYDNTLPKPRRKRTKSWTTISVEPTNDITCSSDSEIIKKDNKKKTNSLDTSNISGSGDGLMNTSNEQNEDPNTSVHSDKKNKKRSEKSLVMEADTSTNNVSTLVSASPKAEVISEEPTNSKEVDKEAKSLNTFKQDPGTDKLFEQAPTGLITSLVYIDDSDSNSGVKENTAKNFDIGYQCVPVFKHNLGLNETKEAATNLSCEPMDIDETLPENISLSTFAQKNDSMKLDDKANESQKRKSSLNTSQIKEDSLLNSKRNSTSNVVSEDILDGTNLPSRTSLEKSSLKDNSFTNNSKRNSTVFNVTIDLKENIEANANKSNRKSSITDVVKDVSIKEEANKSNRKSTTLEDSISKNSSTTSAGALVIDENIDTSLNKSKKRGSVSVTTETIEKEESSKSGSVLGENVMNKSSNKSKDKSSILNEVNGDLEDKNLSKSKRKSSIAQETENHNKTDNDNKSTLVLSQIKDLSQSETNAETNALKESNDTTTKLSKSMNTPNVTLDEEAGKKSLTYLTSTPLQQKSLKKLIQINSSIITPNSTTKFDKDSASKNSTKESSVMSQDSSKEEDNDDEEGDDSEDECEEEESSLERSNFMADEAEDAGDDYESGDSRDEEERDNEEQHEIVGKGETLDSEDEEQYSDDEYEKDSFIVSSDEEDNELLSGSGDDLNMSDNELSMTSKSKQKYNERKSKEQKKASREMFEARHQLNEKPGSKKKNNRQRLDSTSTESDNEVKEQPKKRRQRIDSSQDISDVHSDADKSLTKKRIPRLMSVSFCEEYQKEITGGNVTGSEPRNKKLPMNDSSQGDSNAQSVANKSVSQRTLPRRMSVSISNDDKEKSVAEYKGTEPRNKKLPMTDSSQNLSHTEADADKSLSSEKYGSEPRNKKLPLIDSNPNVSSQSDGDMILSGKKKKKNRLMSVSFCDDIKTNEIENEITICEEAELGKADPLALQNVVKTEPKTPQKDLNISTVAVTTVDEAEQVNIDENVTILESNQTSDPLQTTANADIDEDNESDDSSGDNVSISENEEITDNYEQMLNFLNSMPSKNNKTQDISLNLDKKTKQEKNKEPIVDQLNLTQVKQSKKKSTADEQPKVEKAKIAEKDKQIFEYCDASSDSIDMKLLFPEDSNDAVVVNPNKNEQVKDTPKEKNTEVPDDFIPLKRAEGKTNILENTEIANKSVDESVLNVSGKKKNKRKSVQAVENEEMNEQETSLNFFIDTTGNLVDGGKSDANTSIKSSSKKKKQKNNVSFVDIEEDKAGNVSDEAPLEVSYQSNRNKTVVEEKPTAIETPSENGKKKKKKNKKALNSLQMEELGLFGQEVNETDKSTISIAEGSGKKKKKLSESQVEHDKADKLNISIAEGSSKKKKKSSESQVAHDKTFEADKSNISIAEGSGKKKKKNKKLSESQVEHEKANEDESNVSVADGSNKKNKKNKLSESQMDCEKEANVVSDQASKKRKRKLDDIIIENDVNLDTNNKQKKKKRKIAQDAEETQKSDLQELAQESQEITDLKNSKKKNKPLQHQENEDDERGAKKKNKKRKERDADESNKISKVLKQNSFDKVHVPRLPTKVLQQLDDKPTQVILAEKPNIVSTSSFAVERTKKRRTKPSNYLEQSVYLNDSVDEKKPKGSVKNPKVLPFIPTASTSNFGFTTKFQVKVLSQETQFTAQASDVPNFKKDYLDKSRKKLARYERYKRQRKNQF